MRVDHALFFPVWTGSDPSDLAVLDTLLSSGVFKRVLLSARGEYRYSMTEDTRWSRAEANRIAVKGARNMCRAYGVTSILMRHMWPDLEGQEPTDHMFDPEYYAKRWRETAADAKLLGIPDWALDIEPYAPQAGKESVAWELIKGGPGIRLGQIDEVVRAIIKGVSDLSSPKYMLPAATSNPNVTYSQIGRRVCEKRQRIAIPSSYDHWRSGEVTIPHALMQWVFAADGEVGRYNFATVADLARTDRRIMVYSGEKYIAGFAAELATRPWVPKSKHPWRDRVRACEKRLDALEEQA